MKDESLWDFLHLSYIGSDYTCYREFFTNKYGPNLFYHNTEHFVIVQSRPRLITGFTRKGVVIKRHYSYGCPGGRYPYATSTSVMIPAYAYSSISEFKQALSRLLNVPRWYLTCRTEHGYEDYYVCDVRIDILPEKVSEWVASKLRRV